MHDVSLDNKTLTKISRKISRTKLKDKEKLKSKIWRPCIRKFYFTNEFVYKNQKKVKRKREMNKFSGRKKTKKLNALKQKIQDNMMDKCVISEKR